VARLLRRVRWREPLRWRHCHQQQHAAICTHACAMLCPHTRPAVCPTQGLKVLFAFEEAIGFMFPDVGLVSVCVCVSRAGLQ
jgi:hypothetical protein